MILSEHVTVLVCIAHLCVLWDGAPGVCRKLCMKSCSKHIIISCGQYKARLISFCISPVSGQHAAKPANNELMSFRFAESFLFQREIRYSYRKDAQFAGF